MRFHRAMGLSAALACTLLAGSAVAGDRCSKLYDDIAPAALKYWEWSLGASASQSSGRLFFVPLPDGTPGNGDGSVANPVIYTGATSFTVSSRSVLVLPLSMYIGEGYTRDSLTPDDAPSMVPKSSFVQQSLNLTLDGRTLLDSRRTSLDCAYVPAEYFPAPIAYVPPQFRYTNDQGIDVYASAALWVAGLAVNLPPLEPGRHRLHLYVDTLQGYGYDNTWTITVTAR